MADITTQFHSLGGDFVLTILEAAAVLASALAGMIVAANRRMDIVGAYSLAVVNAFGGGTVRDLMLDHRPFYWMQHWLFLVVIMAICIPFVYNARMYRLASAVHQRSFRVDALGLALFTITGVGIALEQDRPLIVAALMGVIAGTMGGVLRDVVVNETPELFRFAPRQDRATKLLTYHGDVIVNGNPAVAGKPEPKNEAPDMFQPSSLWT